MPEIKPGLVVYKTSTSLTVLSLQPPRYCPYVKLNTCRLHICTCWDQLGVLRCLLIPGSFECASFRHSGMAPAHMAVSTVPRRDTEFGFDKMNLLSHHSFHIWYPNPESQDQWREGLGACTYIFWLRTQVLFVWHQGALRGDSLTDVVGTFMS